MVHVFYARLIRFPMEELLKIVLVERNFLLDRDGLLTSSLLRPGPRDAGREEGQGWWERGRERRG